MQIKNSTVCVLTPLTWVGDLRALTFVKHSTTLETPCGIIGRLSWPTSSDILTSWAFKLSSRPSKQMTTGDVKRPMQGRAKHSALNTSNGLRFSHNGLELKTLTRCVPKYRIHYCQRAELSKTTAPSMWQEFTICTLVSWTPFWIRCFPQISRPSTKRSRPFSTTTPKSSKPSLSNPTQSSSGFRSSRTQPKRWIASGPSNCSGKNSQRSEPSTKAMSRKWRTYFHRYKSGRMRRRRCVMKRQ